MDTYHLYIGDCASTLRSNLYRDYEKYPYGTLEGNCQPRKSYYATLQEKLEKAKKQQNPKKSSCPMCQEEKKRPLSAYMRKRSQDKCGKICEEDEECRSSCHEQTNKN